MTHYCAVCGNDATEEQCPHWDYENEICAICNDRPMRYLVFDDYEVLTPICNDSICNKQWSNKI